MRLLVYGLIWCGMFLSLMGQDTDILLNQDLYHYVDRVDILGQADTLVATDHKPYGRQSLEQLFLRVDDSHLSANQRRWHQRMQALVQDTGQWAKGVKPVLGFAYPNGRDLLVVDQPNLRLFVNPVLYTLGGLDRQTFSTDAPNPLPIYINGRGVQVRGTFFEKLGFYTEISDNIFRTPQFIFNQYESRNLLAGEGFVKRFGDVNGLDFFASRAYLTLSPLRGMRIKFGKDRAFWGNGYQSLALSDHAADYLLLNISTRVWKLEYVNHFTQMLDYIPIRNDQEGTLPRKYGVFHQLNYRPIPQLSVGIFESIVYTPNLANGRRGFELQYLNPIIFYRAIEQFIGSPDNALLGATLKLNLLRRLQVYGQFVLDDFNFAKRTEGDRFWGNKYGWQLGLKWIDVLPTLDMQLEHNRVRPYMYQHFNVASNYTHYGQSLGHAFGANVSDYHLILRYHPWPALSALLSYSATRQGLDQDGFNYGGDPDIPSGNRPGETVAAQDFGHRIGQGLEFQVQQVYGRLSFQLWRTSMYAEIEGRWRKENDLTSLSIMAGLRANIAPRVIRY